MIFCAKEFPDDYIRLAKMEKESNAFWAKGELKKRIERDKVDGRIVGIETVDKMSDHQIAVKVRHYFK